MLLAALLHLVISLGSIFAANYAFAEDTVYRVGVVPQFESRELRQIWLPILAAIEEEAGIRLRLDGSPNIAEFKKALLQGRFDFVYLNPYHQLIAYKKQNYQPLLRDIAAKLQGVLVVHRDSPYQSVEQLQGANIAFPSPSAFAASMLLQAELETQFNLRYKPVYVTTHDSVYLNVALHQFVAGGGVMKTLNHQHQQVGEQLRVIYRTAKVTGHSVAAHPRVGAQTVARFTKAFLKLGDTAEGKTLLGAVPIRRIGVADLGDYLALEKLGLKEKNENK